jgi:hypothetical protein
VRASDLRDGDDHYERRRGAAPLVFSAVDQGGAIKYAGVAGRKFAHAIILRALV